ncbi:phosphate ABC transporter ATP-binding protein PstB [Olsenella sp. HMSC062G07]|uniref:phosphate ABC transporter ATP-binding protein PstB n=1 Tax=Olsenella sp. HMSC062G07 TaxID=1739330 RepID=UPI0008A5FD24|nr:phosphate ABC transporter ATP-binding protein PstB [Olsenella sp. HMSC062G07]OFK23176.1 phosphate ABC transporter ATP-binding protein [Olsenella sp. HMSC062G07]
MTLDSREVTPEVRAAATGAATAEPLLWTKDVTVDYSGKRALKGTSLSFEAGTVTALIGPSGCGKSTYLRSINLMNREIEGCVIGGEVHYHGVEVNNDETDTYALRKQIGMVFQQPNPFRKSIYENVAFAPRCHGMTRRSELDELVRKSLSAAAIWDEVKDKLGKSALALSGGQQQRLCIARTLAMEPDVVLMDEPCSALDPIATFAIEETIRDMAERGICVVIVTHNMEQAGRVADRTAFFLLGDMIECGPTAELFERPKDKRLEDYLTGRFG